MKRKNRLLIKLICFFLAIGLLLLPAGSIGKAQSDDGFWQLVETDVKKNSNQSDGCREESTLLETSYSLFEVTNECLEKSAEGWPCLWASMMSWSQPPKELSAGQKVTFKINMALVYNYSTEQPQDFVDVKLTGGDGVLIVKILENAPFQAATQEGESRDVQFTAPDVKDLSKSADNRINLIITTRAGQVSYIYEWIEGNPVEDEEEILDEQEEVVGGDENEEPVEDEIVEPTETPFSPPVHYELDCSGMNMDSGTRFSDISGNVDVAPCNDPEDYDVARIGMTLYVNDHIRTGRDSSAVLSFTDMTTFIMGPETIIVLESPPQSDSKIRLVWGNVKANIKKILKDGSMNITMNQAVAGIKGTVLVAEETGTESRIKVIEGTVELTDLESGRAFEVNKGQTLAVSEEGFSEVEEFDVVKEKEEWKEFEPASKKLTDFCLLDKLIGLFAVVGLIQLRRKTRSTAQNHDC